MNGIGTHEAEGPAARWATLLAAGIIVMMGVCFYLVPISSAHAEGVQEFCPNTWLDRYGQPSDNCAANDKHYNFRITLFAVEHSACSSTTTNTSKSGVNWSWSCTPGGGNWNENYMNPTVLTNGIIRNNTTGSINHASGWQHWCSTYNCAGG